MSISAKPEINGMSHAESGEVKFEGEDSTAGYASPALDLIAAISLIALSVLVMVASTMLPMPGGLTTAPGLLPFLTGGSLAVMAVLLGLSALARRRDGVPMWSIRFRDRTEDQRALALAVVVAVYIAALQALAFQYHFPLAGIPMVLSAFEPVTTVALAAIIHVSWRGPLWITVTISLGWALALSLVFQKVFVIPLPGGF